MNIIQYISIIPSIIALIMFWLGFKLATYDAGDPINDNTSFNEVIARIGNRMIGAFYVIGSMIIIAIIIGGSS